MPVFRVERNKNYTVMSNVHLRDKRLTLKAKGLLSQMLSLPEDWDYTLAGLAAINREQVDAIRQAVRELECSGYVIRSRLRDTQGRLGKTEYVIYETPVPVSEKPTLENPTLERPTLELPALELPAQENPTQSNTDEPKIESQNTNLSITDSPPFPGSRTGPEENGMEYVERYRELIMENIEYKYLLQERKLDRSELDEAVDLIVETVCSRRKTLRISGDDYPAELVKSKLLKLSSEHIQFVFDCLQENTTEIHNYKKYLLASLFNAPSTISGYYRARVNHDFAVS